MQVDAGAGAQVQVYTVMHVQTQYILVVYVLHSALNSILA